MLRRGSGVPSSVPVHSYSLRSLGTVGNNMAGDDEWVETTTATNPADPNDRLSQRARGGLVGWFRGFACFDASDGYFQVPLDESCQHLTVVITSWGRYKSLVAPMGCVASGDEFNRRAGAAFSCVQQIVRVFDDILRFDRTFSGHVRGVCHVLKAAMDAGITLDLERSSSLVNARSSGSGTSSSEAVTS